MPVMLRRRLGRALRNSSPAPGRVESIVGSRLTGWAADRGALERRQSVDVYVDGKLVRKAMADRVSSAAEAATGDALHGFEVDLPVRVFDGGRHQIWVRVPESSRVLEWSPGRSRVAALDGTEFVVGSDRQIGPYALEGADGWAFLVEDGNGNLDQLLGDLTITPRDLERYVELLSERQRRLAELGIPYLFAVAPSKESIHPRYLPDCSPELGSPTLGSQLISAARGDGLSVVDLHAPLRERAAAGERLYFKRDTHWTYQGGARSAARCLLETARAAGVSAAGVDESQVVWVERTIEEDLFDKPRVRLVAGRLHPLEHDQLPERELVKIPNKAAYGLPSIPTPAALEAATTPFTTVFRSEKRPDAPRAIIYSDSFGTQLVPFLGPAFSWSAWIRRAFVDVGLIESLHPDVVIHVVAERFLAVVPTEDVW
jgi:hypothetical protein